MTDFTFIMLLWVSGLVLGYCIGRFERRNAERMKRDWNSEIAADNLAWRQAEMGNYDPNGHPVNFDRLSDLPPRQ